MGVRRREEVRGEGGEGCEADYRVCCHSGCVGHHPTPLFRDAPLGGTEQGAQGSASICGSSCRDLR